MHQVDPSVAGWPPPPNRPLWTLSSRAREVEVLRLIAAGATNREIATRPVISEGHRRRLL